MTIYSLWDIHSLTIVIVLIKGLSMSGFSFGSKSYSKLWDKKNENREIFILYNFFELDELRFIDIIKNRHDGNFSEIRKGSPSIEIMAATLENNCLDLANYIKDNKNNRNRTLDSFNYRGIRFNLNYKDISLSNDISDLRCAKAYLLNIYNYISLSDEIFSPLTIDDVRLVNFVWSYIRISKHYRNNAHLLINHIDNYKKDTLEDVFQFTYDKLNLIKSPSRTKEKIEQIKLFFGLLSLGKQEKEVEIKFILNQWDNVKDDKKIADWLNNMESRKSKLNEEGKKEIINWSWQHIKTKYYNKNTPAWGGIDDDSSINSTQQQKENIITFFDLMTNEAIKSSIISELKTSASKAKYKILNNKKIHLNIPVNEDTKNMFDKIKTRLNLSNEELLIKMIYNENEKLFKYGAQLDD